MTITGPVLAIVTPFDANGDVDYGPLDEYLRLLIACGIRSIIVNGTTGEFASLTAPERMQLLERCRRSFAGTLINHVSACCYRDCWTLLDHSRDYADAALVLPPFYYAGIDAAGCLAFLRAVLQRCRLPAYLYNFPRHTQSWIDPHMVQVLAREFDCLRGIKDSEGKVLAAMQYKKAAPDLQVFLGSDRGALEALLLGLDGSVTGAGNPVAECLVRLHERFAAGDLPSARQAQQALDRWTDFRESIPLSDIAVSKAALGARLPGFPPHMRPPLVAADQTTTERIRSTLLGLIPSPAPSPAG